MGPSLATTFPGEMLPAAPIAPLANAGDPGIGDQGPKSVRYEAFFLRRWPAQ